MGGRGEKRRKTYGDEEGRISNEGGRGGREIKGGSKEREGRENQGVG